MPLPEPRLETLRELLKECAARVMPEAGGSYGTGFFIDERLLLTCEHVVKGPKGTKVEVRPFGRHARSGTVLETVPGKDNDLALVEVDAVDGEDQLPAVALDRAMGDDITYYTVGYPKEQIAGEVGLEEIGYNGHRRLADDMSVILLMLESGKGTVGSGLSGGPVMNAETGAVVGFVQYSSGTSTDAGGGVIPITRAAKAFPRVTQALERPPITTRRWRDALGRDGWEGLGKVWEWRRWVDVVVEGSVCRWRVKVDSDDSDPLEVTAGLLPDEVSDALFRWSQRRTVRDTDEVKLLGRLLAGAIFPAAVAQRIWENRLADELLVRLRVDGNSDLFDVPWEFVTVQSNGGEKYLAAEEGFGFVRVAPHPEEEKVSTQPSRGEAQVIGVAVQPPGWQKFMPRLGYSGTATQWPKAGQVAQELKKDVEHSRAFTFVPVQDPTPYEVQKALEPKKQEDTSIEVVHYIGFGQLNERKPEMAFFDDYGHVAWRDAAVVFDWVARSNARVFVVEFALPRYDVQHEPVRPRTFLDALSNRVNAVIFTRFPVHPHQCHTFNDALYRVLGEGGSVEAAAQQARTEVQKNEYLGDAAGFGSFTLVTGPKSDTRLVPAHVTDPLASGTKQEPVAVDRQSDAKRSTSRDVTFSRSRE